MEKVVGQLGVFAFQLQPGPQGGFLCGESRGEAALPVLPYCGFQAGVAIELHMFGAGEQYKVSGVGLTFGLQG
jgi:hypothetical protein